MHDPRVSACNLMDDCTEVFPVLLYVCLLCLQSKTLVLFLFQDLFYTMERCLFPLSFALC